jgi:hypothetical protein
MVNGQLQTACKQPPVPPGWTLNQPACFGEANKLLPIPGIEPWIAHRDLVIIMMMSSRLPPSLICNSNTTSNNNGRHICIELSETKPLNILWLPTAWMQTDFAQLCHNISAVPHLSYAQYMLSNPRRWLAVPLAAHSTVSIHSTCFWPILMTCCAYSCTQYSLHTQYMLLNNPDGFPCLHLHKAPSWSFHPFSFSFDSPSHLRD